MRRLRDEWNEYLDGWGGFLFVILGMIVGAGVWAFLGAQPVCAA